MKYELKLKELYTQGFLLIGKINDKEIIENLKKFIKENKDENFSYKTSVKAHFTGFKSLVDNGYFHKFLRAIDECIKKIYNLDFVIHEAWGNLYKKSEEAVPHKHPSVTAFCGILYLTEGGPGTYFHDFDFTIEEEIGKFVLFHPYLLHSVKKIENDIERITVAFNMNAFKEWDVLDLKGNKIEITKINKNDI
jgi:hypothetical protein